MMFTLGEIQRLRALRRNGVPIGEIARLFPGKPIDETSEGWWATIRHQSDPEARDYANQVLAWQGVGIPLINGKPQQDVARNWPRCP